MLALDDKRVLFLGGSAEPEQGKDSSDPRSIHASGEVYDVARQAVATRFALTQRRGGAGAVRLKDGRVWVAGGYSKELNDLIHRDYQYTKTWDMLDVTATPMVVASGELPAEYAFRSPVLLADGRVYLATRTSSLLFDPKTSKFEAIASPDPELRSSASYAHPHGVIVFFWNKAKLEAYALSLQGSWTKLASPGVEGNYLSCQLSDGRVVVMDNAVPYRADDDETTTELALRVYDPVGDSWKPLAPLRARRRLGSLVATKNALIATVGIDTWLRYDLAKDTWTNKQYDYVRVGGVVEELLPLSTGQALVLHKTGSVSLLGPDTLEPAAGPPRAVVWLEPHDGKLRAHIPYSGEWVGFDPETGAWSPSKAQPGAHVQGRPRPRLPKDFPGKPRMDYAAIWLPEQRLLVNGGISEGTDFFKDTWLHSPATGWRQLGSTGSLWNHDLAPLADDTGVLTVDNDRGAFVLDLGSGKWLPTLPAPVKFGYPDLHALPRNRVLVAGDALALYEVGSSFAATPPFGGKLGSKETVWSAGRTSMAVRPELYWPGMRQDTEEAGCLAKPEDCMGPVQSPVPSAAPVPSTIPPADRPPKPTPRVEGRLPLAFDPDASKNDLVFERKLEQQSSTWRYQISVHIASGPAVDYYAQLDWRQLIGAPGSDGQAPVSFEIANLQGVVSASLIETTAKAFLVPAMKIEGKLDTQGKLSELKPASELTGDAEGVYQQLVRTNKVLAGTLHAPDKPLAIGASWEAGIDVAVGDLLPSANLQADIKLTAVAKYRFVGWRRSGDLQLAAVEVRMHMKGDGSVKVNSSRAFGHSGHATGVVYYDPKRREPAYFEMLNTLVQIVGSSFGADKSTSAVARVFALRTEPAVRVE